MNDKIMLACLSAIVTTSCSLCAEDRPTHYEPTRESATRMNFCEMKLSDGNALNIGTDRDNEYTDRWSLPGGFAYSNAECLNRAIAREQFPVLGEEIASIDPGAANDRGSPPDTSRGGWNPAAAVPPDGH